MSSRKQVASLLMGGKNGSLMTLFPVPDSKFRILTAMGNALIGIVPFLLGSNPRGYRCNAINGMKNQAAFQIRKNIEDGDLLRLFLFLSTPIQQLVAERMMYDLNRLKREVESCVRNDPFV